MLEREHNERAWLAWHIAALQRVKKIPQLQSMQTKPPRRQQTWQEQLEIARQWQAVGVGKITTPQERGEA